MSDFAAIGLLAAFDVSSLLWWVDVVLKVAIGIGTVIFVHELGHFLVAKACGVKVEKFMIGFDIGGYKLSWRRGETEYGIGILPLGGYVKMLGQDDDPAHIAEQMRKSQVNEGSTEGVPIKGPDGETYYVDRRSYLAKSVPQRMAIISAGVVMNIIFAFIFAVIAYGMGVDYLPSIVAETVPGSPAFKAGLGPSDEIVRLGNMENPSFLQLKGGVTLGDLENGIDCVVKRAGTGELVEVTLTPTQEEGRLATIGIMGPSSTTLLKAMPALEGSAAANAKLLSPESIAKDDAKFKGDDKLVRIGNTKIEEYADYAAALAKQPSEAITVTVARPVKSRTDSPRLGATVHTEDTEELVFEVAPQSLRDFGLIMEMGPIDAVRADSPAEKAGLQEGDLIIAVDGEAMSSGEEQNGGWNPVTLPDTLRKAAIDEREVELTIVRAVNKKGDTEQQTIRVAPVVPTTIHTELPEGAPMAAEAIGIAYEIGNEVHAIVAGSPAAESKLAAGDRIVGAKVTVPKPKDGEAPEPGTVKFAADQQNWPSFFKSIQLAPEGTTVEFTAVRGEDDSFKVKLVPKPVEGEFVATRGFLFNPIIRTRQAATFAEQVQMGWDETSEALTMVFRFLKKLGGQVPITALGGPVTIAKAAGYSASEGIASLLIFLTMLSANLAVINFLPIPLLDGGHIVFLAYEGLRGRPANERFVVALHTAGFVFIVSLMLYVLALDLNLISRGL